ncbi:MAG: AN1-type zinc finger domain-containing protein [Promethearchaeia archaeon]
MPYCEHCGKEIGYLPFKCRYCGGTFCKKHRLPENHDCTFELKHTPTVPTPSTPTKRTLYQDQNEGKQYEDSQKRDIKKYLKQQRRRTRPKSSFFGQRGLSKKGTSATSIIIILIVIFSIAGTIFPLFFNLSLFGLSHYYFWTIATSLFVSGSSIGPMGDLFTLLFLFILIIFLYNIAKSLEIQFGSKFVLQLYLFCCLMTGLFYFLIRLILAIADYPLNLDAGVYIGLATGGILGLISFLVYFNPNREMMLFCYFIPIRMKGKLLVIILILMRLIPGLLFAISSPGYLALYLPDLGGILGSYLLFYKNYKTRNSRRF